MRVKYYFYILWATCPFPCVPFGRDQGPHVWWLPFTTELGVGA